MAIFVAISYEGFFRTENFYCEKQNTRPKRKPMHDTLALEWFSFSRND